MFKNHFILSLCFLFLMHLSFGASAAPWYVSRTYSSLEFNAPEGEASGLEIIFLPSSDGTQIVWRLGNGRMERALLLDAVETEKNWIVMVPPEIDGSGRWVLTIKGRSVTAIGPRGQVFKLKAIGG